MRAELLIDVKDQTGEGPVWDGARGVLWWTDIPGARVHRWDAASGRRETFAMPGRVGCLAVRADGRLLVAMEHAFGVFDPSDQSYRAIAEPEAGMTGNRFNDGRCDRRGRFFAGSMYEPRGRETGCLWRYDGGGRATRIAGDVTIANGLAWSPDDRRLYWADSPTGRIWIFDYDIATGAAVNRRLWMDAQVGVAGVPDGAAVDADGCYWSARYGGSAVVRFTPEGLVDRVVDVPTPRVTMCAFGGSDLKTLYITTAWNGMSEAERGRDPHAGGVFVVATDVSGLPEPTAAAMD